MNYAERIFLVMLLSYFFWLGAQFAAALASGAWQ
jgi:hypothetical protein